MTFVIICSKHRKIAVSDNSDVQRELAIWLPFVYLSSDIRKRITVEESISLILNGGDPKLMTIYKKEQPFDSNLYLIYRTNIKELNFGFTRSVCLVRLHSDNPVLQCCRKTSRIIWLDIEKVLNYNNDCFWGLQLRRYMKRFDEEIQSVRGEYLFYTEIFDGKTLTIIGDEILKSLNITEKQIQLFFIDFIEHCFPTVVMTFTSFKDYLKKYGFETSEKIMKRLYNGFLDYTLLNCECHYISYLDLLLGLAYIDPHCVFNDCRIQFIFQYYDFDISNLLLYINCVTIIMISPFAMITPPPPISSIIF